jgi:hypothetical protein
VASVLSIRDKVTSGNVDIGALQAELKRQDCVVHETDINAAGRI